MGGRYESGKIVKNNHDKNVARPQKTQSQTDIQQNSLLLPHLGHEKHDFIHDFRCIPSLEIVKVLSGNFL
jgi:hypothetical protein